MSTTRINSIVGLEYKCRRRFLSWNDTSKNSYSSSSHHSISGIGSDNYSLSDNQNLNENSNENSKKKKKKNSKKKKKENQNENNTPGCPDLPANNPQTSIGPDNSKRTDGDNDSPICPDRPDRERIDKDSEQDVDHDRDGHIVPDLPDSESDGEDIGEDTGDDFFNDFFNNYVDYEEDSDYDFSDSESDGEKHNRFCGTECPDTANPFDPDFSENEGDFSESENEEDFSENEEDNNDYCFTDCSDNQEDNNDWYLTDCSDNEEDNNDCYLTDCSDNEEDNDDCYLTDCSDNEEDNDDCCLTDCSDNEEYIEGSESCIHNNNSRKYSHLWVQCENCYGLNYKRFLKEKMNICEECGYHLKMTSSDRIELLIDPCTWEAMDEDMASLDPIEFHSEEDPYLDRIKCYQQETGLSEAVQTGTGQLNGIPVAMGVMDFRFIGGSMGSVVGEKITRLIEYAAKSSLPLIIVCASGGARMQEGSLSLMQMAKISSVLYEYQVNKKLFFVSILTSPTTGGVTASFGMLGDIIIAEPNAYIAFAGKRVIEETLKKTVPEGSQETEFLFDKGLFDLIVPRYLLKEVLTEVFYLHGYHPGTT